VQVYQRPWSVQSAAALNWPGVTINPGVGVGVGVGLGVGVGVGNGVSVAVGKCVGVDLGVGIGLGEGFGEGVGDDMGDGTGDGTFEGPPGVVCGVMRTAVFGKRTGGKAKEDIEMIMAAMTIDEIVTAIQRYLEP
jgi:hypothetical protein